MKRLLAILGGQQAVDVANDDPLIEVELERLLHGNDVIATAREDLDEQAGRLDELMTRSGTPLRSFRSSEAARKSAAR